MKIDEDQLLAGVDLVGRAGALDLEIGYVHDVPDSADAEWYATARYRGAKMIAEDRGPAEAVEVLARRLLDNGTCAHCGQVIRLAWHGNGVCTWTRQGAKWVRGCADRIADGERVITTRGESPRP